MFKPKKSYRVFRGKVTTSGNNTMLSISESSKDPRTGEWKNEGWWNVCVTGAYPCEKGDDVRFTPSAITSISQREYNGKVYYTIFADGTITYKGETRPCNDTPKEEPHVDKGQVIGKVEDLPF